MLDELTDEQIMRDVDFARHAFLQVGACAGPPIFIYDDPADGARHREHLNRLLDDRENRWIVPADTHF